MSRRWLCFDIGEVLVDETRIWSTWADVLGIPRFTFSAVMGAAIAGGRDHQAAFLRLGIRDWQRREDEVQAAFGGISAVDLYPDALPALSALAERGFGVAVIGNQPVRREAELRALGVTPDVMVMSDSLGVSKPSPAFYAEVIRLLAADPGDIAYVGDRIDNDVIPATKAGLHAVWLRRGPWAVIQSRAVRGAALEVDSLEELVRRADEIWKA